MRHPTPRIKQRLNERTEVIGEHPPLRYVVAVIDYAFNADQAERAGVDLRRILVSQPGNAAQAAEAVYSFVRCGSVDFVFTPQASLVSHMAAIRTDTVIWTW